MLILSVYLDLAYINQKHFDIISQAIILIFLIHKELKMKFTLSILLQAALLTSLLFTLSVSAQEEAAPNVWLSGGGSYRFSYSTQYFFNK